MSISVRDLYNQANSSWIRNKPLLLSDYTARPFLLEWCCGGSLEHVLDLGCGEGYFARQLQQRGAKHILGIDISEAMITKAREQVTSERLAIEYQTGSATDLAELENDSFELVVAVFLFNYLSVEETAQTMSEIYRILRQGGRFIFAVPHPSLPFLCNESKPFYFSRGETGYFSGRNNQMEGMIWRRDGEAVPVRCIHKTLEDYFVNLSLAGFERIPKVCELYVTDEIVSIDPDFFSPLIDQPLHLAFKLEK